MYVHKYAHIIRIYYMHECANAYMHAYRVLEQYTLTWDLGAAPYLTCDIVWVTYCPPSEEHISEAGIIGSS